MVMLKKFKICATRSRRLAFVVVGVVVFFVLSVHLLLNRHYKIKYHTPATCIAKDCTLQTPLLYKDLPPQLLLILIHSGAKRQSLRNIIRKTWISDLKKDVIEYRFVVGVSNVAKDVLEKITEESEKHGDMMLLPDVTDSKATLSRRTLDSFSSAVANFRFTYALKCDEDSVVDVPRIATELYQRQRTDRLYWGYFSGAKFLMKIGPYTETHWYICEKYTPIAAGGGYILSRDLAELLSINKDLVTWYVAEDATVSAMLTPYNIERKHDTRLNTPGWPNRGCKEPYLITHKIGADQIPILYKSLTSVGSLCSSRTEWHFFMGYLYNWTTLPSSCCSINHSLP